MTVDPKFDKFIELRPSNLGFAASATAASELARMINGQQETRKLLVPTFPSAFATAIELTKINTSAKLADQILPPMPKLVNDLSRLTDAMSSFGSTSRFGAISEMLKQFSESNRISASTMMGINNSVSVFSRDIQKQLGLARLPNLHLASAAMNKIIGVQTNDALIGLHSPLLNMGFLMTADLAVSAQVEKGFASDLLKHYAEASNVDNSLFGSSLDFVKQDDADEWNLKDSINRLEGILATIESNQTKDPLTFAAILAIIGLCVAIFSLILSYKGYSNDISARAASEAADAMRVEFETKKQAQQEYEKKHIRFIVGRAILRVEPHRDAIEMRKVFPDQLLRVIDSRRDWLLVEVYDYSSNKPITGWLHRGNVRATQR